jgi:RNA polymerase sigma-70 factor (ECF subfamily)
LGEQSAQSDLARSLAGDGVAYARIVSAYQGAIAGHMRAFSRDPLVLEELVQEVFADAYFSLRGLREEAAFSAWLTRIATRVGYRYWKRNGRRREIARDDSWWEMLAQQNVERLDPAVAGQLVHQLLNRLPPRDRLVLVLLYVQGHTTDEAAELAGWSRTMVKVQAFRARHKLRTLLATLGIDDAQTAIDSMGNDVP